MHERIESGCISISKGEPASVVVDENLEITQFRGDTRRYFTLPKGRATCSLKKVMRDSDLFLGVERLVSIALQTGNVTNARCRCQGGSETVDVEVTPLTAGQVRSALIVFEVALEPGTDESNPGFDTRDRQIYWMKQQLDNADERFLFAMEAQQASREEGEYKTEAALSANQDLRRANETLKKANLNLLSANATLVQARDLGVSIVETVRQPLLILDSDLRIRMANRAFYRTFRVSQLEAVGHDLCSLSGGSWDIPGLQVLLKGLLQDGSWFPDFDVEREFPELGRRNLILGGCLIPGLKLILLAVDDVTERKSAALRAEEHLRVSEKMEALGRLSGGIVHDFNNLLTAILCYSELLQTELAWNARAAAQVLEIKKAGERARSLTQQLLDFSRPSLAKIETVNLNLILADLEQMLRRLVDDGIHISIKCAPDLWQAKVDPSEIGRAIMNLWLNARDAMPSGGNLSIQTANLTIAEGDVSAYGLAPGRYIVLSVQDTGVGMNAETKSHLFKPFFTTKDTGKGTGLGLVTVLQIVSKSGGIIHCESELGEGTTFRIFLTAMREEAGETNSAKAEIVADVARGFEVILLVDDDDAVRKLISFILEPYGYVVLQAGSGLEGLELCKSHQGPVDLLLTDLMMPGFAGGELAEAALLSRPTMRILYMSGHAQDAGLKEELQEGTSFLQKPFTPFQLIQKVRETLDKSVGISASTSHS